MNKKMLQLLKVFQIQINFLKEFILLKKQGPLFIMIIQKDQIFYLKNMKTLKLLTILKHLEELY